MACIITTNQDNGIHVTINEFGSKFHRSLQTSKQIFSKTKKVNDKRDIRCQKGSIRYVSLKIIMYSTSATGRLFKQKKIYIFLQPEGISIKNKHVNPVNATHKDVIRQIIISKFVFVVATLRPSILVIIM